MTRSLDPRAVGQVGLGLWMFRSSQYVIRSDSPGNRERDAEFRLIRDRSAKFVERPADSGSLR